MGTDCFVKRVCGPLAWWAAPDVDAILIRILAEAVNGQLRRARAANNVSSLDSSLARGSCGMPANS